MTVLVPSSVEALVDDWRGRGSPGQLGQRWPRARWRAAFPRHGQWFDRLPDLLDRASLAAVCREASESPIRAEQAFLAVMAWGYGNGGLGAYRTANIVRAPEVAAVRLQTAAGTLASAGPLAAYSRLATNGDCNLRGLGQSFGTKFLAFSSTTDTPALVLDRLVADWLSRNTELRP